MHVELLARAYLAKGELAAAKRLLQESLAAQPEHAPSWYLLGTIHEREQRWPAACHDGYGQALALDPHDVDYRVALAQAVAMTAGPEAGLAVLHEADDTSSTDPRHQLAIADLSRQAGRLPEAILAYERALAFGPNDPAARTSLALCLYWAGRGPEALQMLEPLISAEPDPEPAVMVAYAGALLQTAQPRPALTWLSRFTASRPDVPQLWILVAQASLALNERPPALDAVRRAVQLAPQSPDVLTAAAAAYLAAGEVDAAARSAAAAIRLKPENAEALLVLGRTSEHRGDRDGARAAYRAAAQWDRDGAAAELLARLDD